MPSKDRGSTLEYCPTCYWAGIHSVVKDDTCERCGVNDIGIYGMTKPSREDDDEDELYLVNATGGGTTTTAVSQQQQNIFDPVKQKSENFGMAFGDPENLKKRNTGGPNKTIEQALEEIEMY